MIEGYVGLLGGGKSLNATDRMMRYIAGGGVVYTNMNLVRDPWYNVRFASKMKEFKLPCVPFGVHRKIGSDTYVFLDEHCIARVEGEEAFANSCGYADYLLRTYKWRVQPGQYNRLSNDDLQGELHSLIPKGTPDKPVLCVLDEAVDFFDTDDRKDANKEFLSFLRHSRKQAVDMIFIAQEFSELNKRIRNQTQFIWTFWDMSTFRVPGLRSTLPPPWRNMILCQQWNNKMTGGVLKRIWKTRDVGLFGCYKTDELFRSLKSADGKTDFSGEGDVRKEEGDKRMNTLERVALFAALLFSALGFFSKGDMPQSANAEAVAVEAVAVEPVVIPETKVLYGRFCLVQVAGKTTSLRVNGITYKPGQMTTSGTVLSATGDHIHIRDDFGNDTFIYPKRDFQGDSLNQNKEDEGGYES